MPSPSAHGAPLLVPVKSIRAFRIRAIASFLILSVILLLGHASWAKAKDNPTAAQSNDEIKAAHIFKFKKYATWPEETLPENTPLVIGVVGADVVAATLEQLAAKHEQDKPQVIIKKLQTNESLDGIHLLYIGQDRALELSDWLTLASGKPILCVTETGNGMPPGSMINFVKEEDRIRFDVSLTAAEISQIKLSAALLTVARQVYGGKS